MAKRRRPSSTSDIKEEAARVCLAADQRICEQVTTASVSVRASLSLNERDELEQLRRRVERLEAEREILIKAALFLANTPR